MLTTATTVGGVALAVLVGVDGSPGWRIARIAVVAVATTLAVLAQRRYDDRARGRLAVVLGVPLAAIGAGFLPFAVKGGTPVLAAAGIVAVGAGLVLAVAGTVVGTRGRRVVRRVGAEAGTAVAAVLVAFVVGPAVAATNVPRPEIGDTPKDVGLAYMSVTLTTADGVDLAAWYVPSRIGVAVVLLHGAGSTRSNTLDHAAVLAAHGFGVLMVDARGHGGSGGRAMDFGWHGDADIAAATAWLARRPDVDEHRIGALGLSMGGEEALGATASNPLLRVVVAEGATARTAADEGWLSDPFGARGFLQEQLERVQDRVLDVLTSAAVPTSLRAAVEASRARYLLIAAGDVPNEAHAAAYVAAGAPDRVETWTVPGAGHTRGLAVAPEEWEARVTGFLAVNLRALDERGDTP